MMRLEVQQYMRASSKLFGLAYEEGALTLAERAAILSFAQAMEKKFLLSREEGDVPLSVALTDIPLIQPYEADGPHLSVGTI